MLARRGRVQDGERFARQAVQLFGKTDMLDCRGDALIALSEVLRTAGRAAEAGPVTEEALHLYEQKGNVVSAGAARKLLAALPQAARAR